MHKENARSDGTGEKRQNNEKEEGEELKNSNGKLKRRNRQKKRRS